MTSRQRALRLGTGSDRVTNVELFFDLVYVFAVTQLSHLLVQHTTPDGAVQVAVLLAMVWQVWVYTTWYINYLEPDRTVVRAVLLLLMLGSLVLAAGLPDAFHGRGMLVAVCYVSLQVGRALVTIVLLRGEVLQRVFLRILPWSTLTGALVIVGALEHGHAREVLWALSVAIDLAAAAVGFWLPGYGRSDTREWTISGGHFAERCQAFVLIALGESIVVTGSLLRLDHPGWRDIVGYGAAFAGVVGLWWIYFDRAAGDSTEVIESAEDPGRLARSAFHWVHPLIVGGIIVTAAADEKVLEDPGRHGHLSTAWLVLGGTGLFLAGHALFKAFVWRVVSWSRVLGVLALALTAVVAPHVSALTTGIVALAVVVCVAMADRLGHPPPEMLATPPAQPA